MTFLHIYDYLARILSGWKNPAGKEFAGILILFWIAGLGIGVSIASAFTLYWILFLLLGAICLVTCPCIGAGIIGASTTYWVFLKYIALNVFIYIGFIASCISLLSLLALIRDRSKLNIRWVVGILLVHSVVVSSLNYYNLIQIPLNLTLFGLSPTASDKVKEKNHNSKKDSQLTFEKDFAGNSEKTEMQNQENSDKKSFSDRGNRSIESDMSSLGEPWLNKNDFESFYEINFPQLKSVAEWYWEVRSQPFTYTEPKRPKLPLGVVDRAAIDVGELLNKSSSFLKNLGFACERMSASNTRSNKSIGGTNIFWCGVVFENSTGEIIVDVFTEGIANSEMGDRARIIRYFLKDKEALTHQEFVAKSSHLFRRSENINWRVLHPSDELDIRDKADFFANPYGIACLSPLSKNLRKFSQVETFCVLGRKPSSSRFHEMLKKQNRKE